MPLAKKCNAIFQELGGIIDAQITEQCTNKLSTDRYQTEAAATAITMDNLWDSKYRLDRAIYDLKLSQVYGCATEEKIATLEFKLIEIKSQIK